MAEKKKSYNRTSPFYTDVDVRIKIHECERKIAVANANIGKDNRNLPEGKDIKKEINGLIEEIKVLDFDYYDEFYTETPTTTTAE